MISYVKKLFSIIPIVMLSFLLISCDEVSTEAIKVELNEVANHMFDEINTTNITSDMDLIKTKDNILITWVSSNLNVVSNEGIITRQENDTEVMLTALLTLSDITIKQDYIVIVKAKDKEIVEPDPIEVLEDVALHLFDGINLTNVINDLKLVSSVDLVSITWTTSNPIVIDGNGKVSRQEVDVNVSLFANLRMNDTSINQTYFVTVKALKPEVEDPLIIEKLNDTADHYFDGINISNITNNLTLVNLKNEVAISWTTNNASTLSAIGLVIRQATDTVVELSATFSIGNISIDRAYNIIVKAKEVVDPNPDPLMSYYSGAENKSGEILKSFLHNLIDDHQEYSYDYAKTALTYTDQDPNNPDNVILFYTGRSQAKTKFGSLADDWNREHVWAKSHGNFGTTMGPGTDLHHLRPTDASVNSTRNNKDFDEGGSLVSDTYGVGSTFCYSDYDSFEPRDEVKGDVARILFYMAVRYEGDSGEPDLELNELVNNDFNPYMGKLSVLLRWNLEDPVDDFERNRNEVIFGYQKNRNPFIDYSEFANLIWAN